MNAVYEEPGSAAASDFTLPKGAGVILGNLELDLEAFRVLLDGEVVELTFHEFELLILLARHLNRVESYKFLIENTLGDNGRDARRHLSVLIYRLRAKLDKSWPYRITTVRGRGYGFLIAPEAIKRHE
jgi:DNA-binding response OmpR family regulator